VAGRVFGVDDLVRSVLFGTLSSDGCHEWFNCHEQLSGARFAAGSTRAAGFDICDCCRHNELG